MIRARAARVKNLRSAVENNNQKIGVSQKAIIYNNDGKILTMRRTETAPAWALNWDLPGGELEYGEEARAGIRREIKEEAGLEVENLDVIDVNSDFDDINEFWVTICYSAKAKTAEVVISREHDQFKWVAPDEFLKLKASPTNKKFVERFILQNQLDKTA